VYVCDVCNVFMYTGVSVCSVYVYGVYVVCLCLHVYAYACCLGCVEVCVCVWYV